MTHILLAGDLFDTTASFRDALDAAVDEPVTYSEWTGRWPLEPFGDIGGVREASGGVDELIARLEGAQVAVTQMAPFTREVFHARPDLRMVGVCRGGPVNVDLDAATEAGVLVTFAPGRNAQAAAEFTVGLILAVSRRIAESDRDLRSGVWRGDNYTLERVGLELDGAVVGLIGYGAIGRIVARILQGFGSAVIAFDPYANPGDLAADGVQSVGFDELLTSSDVVSLHARYTPDTHHLLDEAALRKLKRGAILINAARGGLLDYGPLPELLEQGQLGGVAVDVYDIEPPPVTHPLLQAPNVVLTPHLAGATRQTADRAAAIVARDVADFLAGRTPTHIANPAALTRNPS